MTPEEFQEALQLLRSLPPRDILYRALFGECRGEPVEAQIGVGCVVRNRVQDPRWPDRYGEVLLQPGQFSCFNRDDPNLPKLLDPEGHEKLQVLEQLQWVAQGIVNDLLRDNVAGANHYYDFSIIVGRGQQEDPMRLARYLRAVDLILDPDRLRRVAGTGISGAASDQAVQTAKDMIHSLVADLPPKWDNEVPPCARKGRIVFFKL